MFLVDINQWRAAIGCFCVLLHSQAKFLFLFDLSSLIWQIAKLFCLFYFSICVSIFFLPVKAIVHFFDFHSVYSQYIFSSFSPFSYSITWKVLYAIASPASHSLSRFQSVCHNGSLLAKVLCVVWVIQRLIVLSGDIELNPGPETLNFCCWNLNSITAYNYLRLSLIEAYNSVYEYDLIGVVETHLDSSTEEEKLILNGYSFISQNHPQDIKRGGVGLYIKDSLPYKERSDIATLPKCIVCELHLNRKKFFFTIIYRSPSQNHEEFDIFLINFELMLSKMFAENPYAIIISGDFNCRSTQWWDKENENEEGRSFEPLISDLGLHQLINEPTHIIGEHRSCIDLVLTNQPNIFLEAGVHPSLHEFCHHQIVYGKLLISNLAPPPYTRRIWHYDRADSTAICRSIIMYQWNESFQLLQCPNEQVKLLTEVVYNVCSNFIPNDLKKIRPCKAPWVTKAIKTYIRKKNRAYKSFVKNGQPAERYNEIQSMISLSSKMVEDAKHKYFSNTGARLANCSNNRKAYWSLINKILNKGKTPEIPPLLENDTFVLDLATKAQIFNDYFLLQCSTLNTGSDIPQNSTFNVAKLSTISITDEKILKIIRSLKPNKAHGWDNVSVRMIKYCDSALVLPLKLIFLNCLSKGIFPDTWKCANVVPVHKKNERNLKENYRPISLLLIFGKILEKLIFDSLYSHLIANNLLNPNQSGFRPGDSAINQLLSITQTIHSAFDCDPPLEVRSVFLDISKAFDRVWHKGLLYKLRRCGISGNLFNLLHSFLSNRKQRTVLNGKSSSWGNISAGVPQGSILGPLMFLVYINDLTENLKCSVKLFADDTSLFTIVKDPKAAADYMNHDLNLIQLWANKWRMSFNPDPRKQAIELIFSTKRDKTDHPILFFNNLRVTKKDKHKHLGLVLDSKLSFLSHINAAISKSRKALGLLKFLSKYLSRETLNALYKLYIRPHLDYGDVIYHIPNKEDSLHCHGNFLMEKVESVQYSAALAITGAWRGTSR